MRDELDKLSKAERVVFALVVAGRTHHQVAEELNRSPETVRNHLKRVCQKLGARSQVGLLRKFACPSADSMARVVEMRATVYWSPESGWSCSAWSDQDPWETRCGAVVSSGWDSPSEAIKDCHEQWLAEREVAS